MYCYRHTPRDQWLLCKYFTPEKDACHAYIVATEGPLPVGAHTWQLGPSALGKPAGSGWEGRTLTVGLLVRPPLPYPAACAHCPLLPASLLKRGCCADDECGGGGG